MKILVTGASGNLGSLALDYVRQFAPEAEIFGLVRDAGKAAVLEARGYGARIGSYTDPASLDSALEGIDRLLFVSTSEPGVSKNLIDAARTQGVTFIAYTSITGIEQERFGLEINHRQVEGQIAESGIAHTFVRNGWYLDMMQDLLTISAREGVFPSIAGEEKVSWILRRELAEIAARVVTGEGYPEVLQPTGTAVSYRELAEALSLASGKEIEYRQVTDGELTDFLTQKGASQMGIYVAGVYQQYAQTPGRGEDNYTTKDAEAVLARPLTPLPEAIAELIK